MIYVLSYNALGYKQLRICNIDGSGDRLLYDQNYAEGDATQEQLVIAGFGISWSWDETKLCCIDARDQNPVFLVDTTTGVPTEIYPGLGWSDFDLEQFLNTPLSFDTPLPTGLSLDRMKFRVA